jgi:hypothetical protein
MLVAELSKISIRLFIHEGRFDLCFVTFVRTFYTNMGGQKSDQTFVKLFVHKGYFDLYFLFVLIFFCSVEAAYGNVITLGPWENYHIIQINSMLI